MSPAFLSSRLYSDPEIAARERRCYATRLWHPVAASCGLPAGHILATRLLDLPLLLSRQDGVLRAFLNRCPHRGMPFADPAEGPRACRRLVCPYHGWTYDLQGRLRAAAREDEFLEPFNRTDWPLQPLPCRELAGLIWVAAGERPLPLEDQLDLLIQEGGALLEVPRRLLRRSGSSLHCNWKVANDNTLDDYHVAIAHPLTLHREQGPVRHYRHAFSEHGSLLATPWGGGGEFLTFGLAPWTHLLLWPDGRMVLLQFPPIAVDRCAMDVWLLGGDAHEAGADAWLEELNRFLEEDRRLVEGAQQGYVSGLVPGPAHGLERRILQQQALYSRLMGSAALDGIASERAQEVEVVPGLAASGSSAP